jgi:hypothetical protein
LQEKAFISRPFILVSNIMQLFQMANRQNRCLKCTGHAGFDVLRTHFSHRFGCPRAGCNCQEFCQKPIQASKRVRKAQIGGNKFNAKRIRNGDANVSNAGEGKSENDANLELEVFNILFMS